MKKTALVMFSFALLLLECDLASITAAPGFRRVSDHFFYLESAANGANTGAVITGEGVLLIDLPPEPEIPGLLNALKAITSRPVRWITNTDYQHARSAGAAALVKQGAAFIGSKELDRLATATPAAESGAAASPQQATVNPRFLFGRQLHLFPSGIEIRILAVKHKARTAGDVVIFLPSEKVLQVGDFFIPGSYPAIDSGPGEGSAPGWIDGMKEVIDSVPLLKSAMPQPKADAQIQPEQEKTLEESVTVVPGHGAPANLQQMKALFTAAQKLRTAATRAVAAGRTGEDFVSSLAMDIFGEYDNLETFAALLFDELSKRQRNP